jgi:nucleoside-diphosphate-sugar epimerase
VKALVTGAAGFLGGHLVEMLVERGEEVRALIQLGQDATLLQGLPGVEVVEGDLTDIPSLKRAVQDIQLVYHIAARTGPWGPEAAYQATNVQGVLDLITVAMDAGVERIVHTSSITVYGHHLRGIVHEDHPYHAEDNPYSRTKIASEKAISRLVQEKGAPVVMIRPAWIYGPRDTASFGRFVQLIQSGKGFIIGSGKNIVPIVYVRDVAQGLLKAGDAGDEVIGRAYTIADDRRVTQQEYLNTIADALQVPHVTRHYPFAALYYVGRCAETVWKVKDPRRTTPPPVTTYGVTLLGGDQQFSIDRARQELGYEPEYNVKRGVTAGVAWHLQRQKDQSLQKTVLPLSDVISWE